MASNESSNTSSLSKITGMPVPSSPRKLPTALTFSVLNKSPLRPTSRGKMFSLNVFDEDPSSTVRAVCFSEGMFDSFTANTTYDVVNAKVKKAFGTTSLCPIELLIDAKAKVNKAVKQLDFGNVYVFNSVSSIER